MFPTIIEIQTQAGALGLHTYGMMILMAFCAGFIMVHLRAGRIGLHPDRLLPIYLAAAIGGISGGRLLFAFAVDWERTIANPLVLFQPAGFAVYGGIIGGIIAVAIAARFAGITPWKLADIAAPAVLLGMGIGRLGCLLAGCCHGGAIPDFHAHTGLLPESFAGGQVWTAFSFPFVGLEFGSGGGGVTRPSLQDIPLYPTQLWATVALTGISFGLYKMWKVRQFDGQIAAIALMLEPITRITIEAFRADHRGYAVSMPISDSIAAWLPTGMTQAGAQLDSGTIVGLTTSQAIGIGSILFGIGIYAFRHQDGRADVDPDVIDQREEDLYEVPEEALS